jgi:alpha-mannosidase
LYDYFRRDHPESFERLRQRVVEGRWETVGGMWIEADCNISGAESLARQFVLGRRFYREHFGSEIDSPVLWLPDVFGFPWSLPQLAREAGMRYFFTIKLRWSEFNSIPYDSFWWEGLDGTRILTHFSTTPEAGNPHFAATYNADPTPGALLASWHKVKLKDVQRDILMSYGWGDGGGGPTRDMLDRIRALGHFPALPQVGFSSARAFFETLEAASGARLPAWSDELYLETHQGTLTTQARTKRDNRKAEVALHDLEFLASYAAQLAPTYRYPAAGLRDAWSLVCLNQFHDILPGSSIPEVYTDSRAQYAQVIEQAGALRAAAVEALAAHAGGDVVIVNPIGFSRHDLAVLPAGTLAPGAALIDPSGAPVPLQTSADGDLLIDAGQIAPYSLLALAVIDGGDAPTVIAHSDSAQAETHALENAYLRAEFDSLGDLVRVYDKVRRRELLPPGARANFFQAFDDRPANFDAWNIDVSYEDRVWTAAPADQITIAEQGPLRAALTIERRILGSTIRQRISLERHSPALHFDTWVDWRERHILLKVAFPVDVLAARASFDIQWGHIQRPTHRSTSWDWAKYEVALHKWMDVSEGDYGVSLLNDCKYGGDVRGSVLRLSLLRSPAFPDPDADSGAHQFSYCLLPHSGPLGSDTLRGGYALNHPLLALDVRRPEGQSAPRSLPPLVRADRPNVVIETIKLAEDGDGLIVRLYDGLRQRGETLLTFAFPVESAQRTNVLEEAQHDLPVDGHTLRLTLRPFEIATLRVRRRAR